MVKEVIKMITKFQEVWRGEKFSFVFAVSKCANEFKEFRYRFVDGKPVEFERINTAFTYLNKETELYKVVNVEIQDTLEEYVAVAARTNSACSAVK